MRGTSRNSLWLQPENLFLLFALPFGIVFAFLLPPLTGSDEYFHYHRIAAIAYGGFYNEPVAVPSGIAAFLHKTLDFLTQDNLLPYTQERIGEVSAIPLNADETVVLQPNYLTIHSPANYIPQVIAFRLAAFFGASPLTLMYVTRLSALLASVWVVYHAIRAIPSWKYALCALALVPPLELYRVCLSTDALTDAFGIYFLACIMREMPRTDLIKRAALLRIALLALLLGACKLPYICLSLLVLAIPGRRFSSSKMRYLWCAFAMIPGALAGLWWMETSRRGIFVGLHYETWGGSAYPDGQVAYILHDPLGFLGVLARTMFSFSFWGRVTAEFIGHFGTMSQGAAVYYVIMLGLFIFTLMKDGTGVKASYPSRARALALPAFAGFTVLTLTALYIHWTGLQAPEVKGFQGRYLHPLLPMLLLVLPFRGKPHAQISSAFAAGLFGLMGLTATVPVLLAHWK